MSKNEPYRAKTKHYVHCAADSDHDSNDSEQEEQKGILEGDTPNEPNTVCYVFVFLSIKWLIADWSLFIVID